MQASYDSPVRSTISAKVKDQPIVSPPAQKTSDAKTASAVSVTPSWQHNHRKLLSGLALMATIGGSFQVIEALSPHEGEFQLNLKTGAKANGADLDLAPTKTTGATLAAPTSITPDAQLKVLFSRPTVAPALEQLQDQGIEMTYDALVENLELQPTPTGELWIRFHHQTPRVTQQTLQQLALAYANYQTCDHTACETLERLQSQVPPLQTQIRETSHQIKVFQSTYSGLSLEAQQRKVDNRATEVREQRHYLAQQLGQVESQLLDLIDHVSLQSQEISFLYQLLEQDFNYQEYLQQLKTIEQEIASELSVLSPDQTLLNPLYEQYHETHQLLNAVVEQLVVRPTFLAALMAQAETLNSNGQDLQYSNLLQALLKRAHHHQVLSLRQETLQQVDNSIEQQGNQLTQLHQKYEQLQTSLIQNNQALAELLKQQNTVEEQIAQESIQWQLVDDPDTISVIATNPWLRLVQLPLRNQKVVLMSLLLGGGLLTAITRSQPAEQENERYSYLLKTS